MDAPTAEHLHFLKNCALTDQQIHWIFDDTPSTLERKNFVLSLRDGAFQERLFSLACLSAQKYTLNDLCPSGETAVFEGRNTFPAFSRFQKIFFHPPGQDKLFGYNKQSTSFVTGPGYFEVISKPDGVLLFDYDKVPAQQPKGFPKVTGNDSGIGKLVYGGLRDDVAAVSKNVWIGRARKDGKIMGYFILVR